MTKLFSFEAKLLYGCGEDYKNISRTIDILEDNTLEELACFIISSFGFDVDHSFGFYDDQYDGKEAYTVFFDMGNAVLDHEKSIEQAIINQVFKKGKTLTLVFDYGDDWNFSVKCIDVKEKEPRKHYPKLISSKGKAPEQYPDYDEE